MSTSYEINNINFVYWNRVESKYCSACIVYEYWPETTE